MFVWMKRNDVSVFLNDINAAAHDYPDAARLPPGGTAALFFVITGVDAYHAQVAPKANVIMPLKTQFYGMREFAVTDPDGHIITFAERVSRRVTIAALLLAVQVATAEAVATCRVPTILNSASGPSSASRRSAWRVVFSARSLDKPRVELPLAKRATS